MYTHDQVTRREFVKGGVLALGLGSGLGAGSLARADSEAGWAADAVLADFEALYPRLREAHFDLYARRSRAEYDAKFRQMRPMFTRPMARDRVRVEFQRFVAFGRVAHAHVAAYWKPFADFQAAGGGSFPLAIKVIDGRAYVTENLSERDDIAAGSELLRVNRRAFTALRPRLHAYLAADNAYLADTLLELDLAYTLWAELGALPRFDVVLRSPDGRWVEAALAAATTAQMKERRAARPTLAATDFNQRTWRMLDERTGYLRPGPFYNHEGPPEAMYDNRSFATFIDTAFRGLKAANARELLIDLRNNPGGDNSFSDLMVSWVADKPFQFASDFRIKVSKAAIESNRKRVAADPANEASPSARLAQAYAARKPGDVFSYDIPVAQPRADERFRGKCFVLVNRYSYSNAVNVAALMQDYGFAKILGEETSDLATSYGAMEQFTLERTGIEIGFPKALIIRPSGSLTARGVIPDVAISTPIRQSERDEVLERAVVEMRSTG